MPYPLFRLIATLQEFSDFVGALCRTEREGGVQASYLSQSHHPAQMTFEQSPKEWQSLEKMTIGWRIQSSRPQFPRAQAGVIVSVAVCGVEVRDWSAPCRSTAGMTPLVWLSELGNGDSHVQAWRELWKGVHKRQEALGGFHIVSPGGDKVERRS